MVAPLLHVILYVSEAVDETFPELATDPAKAAIPGLVRLDRHDSDFVVKDIVSHKLQLGRNVSNLFTPSNQVRAKAI